MLTREVITEKVLIVNARVDMHAMGSNDGLKNERTWILVLYCH